MISPNYKSHHVPLTDVYVRIKASDSTQEIEAHLWNDNPVVQLFYSRCKESLIENVKRIQSRFDDCKDLMTAKIARFPCHVLKQH